MYRIYGKNDCPACQTAKNILLQKGYPVQFIDVALQENKDTLLAMLPGAKMVPQIFLNHTYIGSLPDLKNHLTFESDQGLNEDNGIKIQLNG